MRERPILFSAPMVRAIIEGRKTQTRRVMKVPPSTRSVRWVENAEMVPSGGYTGWVIECDAPLLLPRQCPYGVPGDRLWVRETWACSRGSDGEHERDKVIYRADPMFDGCGKGDFGFNWAPSLFMPRWASRIMLEVTGVRVERLQDISFADAVAEGLEAQSGGVMRAQFWGLPEWRDTGRSRFSAIDAYQAIWESINGSGSWDANPWVWVIDFRAAGGE